MVASQGKETSEPDYEVWPKAHSSSFHSSCFHVHAQHLTLSVDTVIWSFENLVSGVKLLYRVCLSGLRYCQMLMSVILM